MKYLLKNGTVVTGEKSEQLDILVEGEKIVQVGKNLPSKDAQEIDVSGKLLFPGFIDGHTHFDLEVAGTVTADDFETGTKAAILGGTTFVIDYASQDKGGHTLKEGLDKWHKKADDKCSCDYSFHMSIVEWNEKTEQEIQDMIDHGITSFKLYMTYPAMIVNDCDMYKIWKMWLFCRCALRECRRDRCADRRSKKRGKTWTGKSSTGASGYDGSGSCSPSARDCQGGRCTGDGSTSYK